MLRVCVGMQGRGDVTFANEKKFALEFLGFQVLSPWRSKVRLLCSIGLSYSPAWFLAVSECLGIMRCGKV